MAHTEAIIGGFGGIGLKQVCMCCGFSLQCCLILEKRRLVLVCYIFIDEFVDAELQIFIVGF